MWVLTIGVLEVNPEVESIRAQSGRALFSRVPVSFNFHIQIVFNFLLVATSIQLENYSHSTKKRASRASALRADGLHLMVDF